MKSITYKEFIEMARKNYNKGGDGIIECWDENTFNDYVEMFGKMTKKDAMNLIKI